MSRHVRTWTANLCSGPRLRTRDLSLVVKLLTQMSTKVYSAFTGQNIGCRRPEFWARGRWFLLHDNGRQHMVLSVKEFLSVYQILLLLHASYSSYLSYWGFSIFPWLKRAFEGHLNADFETIRMAVTKELCRIPKKSVAQDCFKDLKESFNDARRTYF